MLTKPPKSIPLTHMKSDGPKTPSERRHEERILFNLPVVIARSGSGVNREFLSMTFNRSEGGLCLETSEPFETGAVLSMRPGQSAIGQTDRAALSTFSRIEVQWCSEYLDEFNTLYRIGVKHFV